MDYIFEAVQFLNKQNEVLQASSCFQGMIKCSSIQDNDQVDKVKNLRGGAVSFPEGGV